ncbi:hypothetical protein V6Z11_A11G204000 [Gossypium hirsutum]
MLTLEIKAYRVNCKSSFAKFQDLCPKTWLDIRGKGSKLWRAPSRDDHLKFTCSSGAQLSVEELLLVVEVGHTRYMSTV